ncbi:MAG: DUF4114 domain-containing protein [Desulfobacterales bacterium]|nr:DUF4114 domain-containing protein [Desulfobacterales bacterium]
MKKYIILLCSFFTIFLIAENTKAVQILENPDETPLQTILDNITVGPVDPDGNTYSSIDVNSDQLSDLVDSFWSIAATGGSISTFIIEIAGYANLNSLGLYDPYNPSSHVELFGGNNGEGDLVLISIFADGSVYKNFSDQGIDFTQNEFGYYFINGAGDTFYSDTNRNSDGFDHMVAFQGNNIDIISLPPFSPGTFTPNEFIFAWEDSLGGDDQDFNDMILMVESVSPVPNPEPATLLLFGSGLIGVATIGRKKYNKKIQR